MLGKNVLSQFDRLRYKTNEQNWNKEIKYYKIKVTHKNIEINEKIVIRDYIRPNYKVETR